MKLFKLNLLIYILKTFIYIIYVYIKLTIIYYFCNSKIFAVIFIQYSITEIEKEIDNSKVDQCLDLFINKIVNNKEGKKSIIFYHTSTQIMIILNLYSFNTIL